MITHIRRTVIGCALLVLPTALAVAYSEPDAGRLASQRTDFKAAEAALAGGSLSRFRALKGKLKSYPLYPYLEYEEIRRQISSASPEQVRGFLDEYADTPLADRLRAPWLDHLARRGRWAEYLEFHRPGPGVRRRCLTLQALLNTGKRDQALARVEPIWLHGKSQPAACDPVFAAWREAGRLTPELVWRRIDLAMERRQIRLARYLGRSLSAGEHVWLDRWLQVHHRPAGILNHAAFKQAHPRRNRILMHGLKRLAGKDVSQALDAWQALSSRYRFSADEDALAERFLALALIGQDHADALDYLAGFATVSEDATLRAARLRTALAAADWETVLGWITSLPAAERDSPRWRYWKARALESTGKVDQARAIYEGVRAERDYYGFLAADRLGSEYRLEHAPLRVADDEVRDLAQLPGIGRARELFALGRLVSARREWEYLLRDLNATELLAAAKLAHAWGWHDRAIFAVARARYWDDLELRFPLEHRERVERVASEQGLDSAWVFAMLRQESAFMSDARSSKGALGLMQLMPRTARQVARQLRDRRPRTDDLLRPATNIRYGTAYLKQVFESLDRNPVLAIAAYNAGPHRVRSWMPECAMPADIWVETVPFRETRTYLRRVLAYTAIYEDRLGGTPTRLAKRMQPVGACEKGEPGQVVAEAVAF